MPPLPPQQIFACSNVYIYIYIYPQDNSEAAHGPSGAATPPAAPSPSAVPPQAIPGPVPQNAGNAAGLVLPRNHPSQVHRDDTETPAGGIPCMPAASPGAIPSTQPAFPAEGITSTTEEISRRPSEDIPSSTLAQDEEDLSDDE